MEIRCTLRATELGRSRGPRSPRAPAQASQAGRSCAPSSPSPSGRNPSTPGPNRVYRRPLGEGIVARGCGSTTHRCVRPPTPGRRACCNDDVERSRSGWQAAGP